jgi:hypothetical protein
MKCSILNFEEDASAKRILAQEQEEREECEGQCGVLSIAPARGIPRI